MAASGVMTSFWKATRLDGTDFWSGRVRYDVGQTVVPEPLPPGAKPGICDPGYLHAADVPAETLVGGWWPCRLFVVEGTPAVGFDAEYPHKGGFLGLTVIHEAEAWQALGPNGRDVAALLDRATRLTSDEIRQLAAAWDAAGSEAWDAAWLTAWDAGQEAARGAAQEAAWDAACRTAQDAAWNAARDAAWSAAGALVVRDLIPPDTFDVLYGPWASVIERGAG